MNQSLLVGCPACGKRLSRKATACPDCGHPNTRVTRASWAIAAGLLLAGAVLVGWRVQQQQSRFVERNAEVADALIATYESLPADAPPQLRCSASRHIASVAGQYRPDIASQWHATAARDCAR